MSNPIHEHPGDELMTAPTVKDAMEKTSYELVELQGLVKAIDQMAYDHPLLSQASDLNHSFISVVGASVKAAKRLTELHDAEFKALKAEEERAK